MNTVIETAVFLHMAQSVFSAAECDELAVFLATNPLAGDVIVGGQGLRKLRFARSGMGKRGGARVIYFNRLESGVVVLLACYAKAKFDNLSTEFMVKLKEKFDGKKA